MDKKNMLFTSVIDVKLWDEAIWRAVVIASNQKDQPYLGLAFENEKAAIKIFENWIERFGAQDAYEEIYISIIEGDIPEEEAGYTVHINSSMDNMLSKCKQAGISPDTSLIVTIGRLNRMNPEKYSRNLETFKEEFKRHSSYKIFPVVMMKNMQLKPLFDLAIEKTEIHFRSVEDIKEEDLDSVVIKKS
ncbi:hypothetical protein [Paenibacillus xylanexedens]|uniref:hypothetical protein n=1 Tax=Paenibacillus xylanexedens TaxID=528191 RepID=UPI000F542EE7|nr:hypothetical protein [Paenibacillus xylanexedens]RPK29525.1 hypothetical protein EDO6_00148 [Paenibacillus xylanexedens]